MKIEVTQEVIFMFLIMSILFFLTSAVKGCWEYKTASAAVEETGR